MKTNLVLACCALVLTATVAFAEETEPNEIFKKVQAAYDALDSYSSKGTVVADVKTQGAVTKLETSFSVKLQKPNRYLITWKQPGFSQAGAVWSDGKQPYFYTSVTKSYSKMSSDELALAAATGVSGGAANTIPMLFLSSVKKPDALLSKLAAPKLEPSEQVEGMTAT